MPSELRDLKTLDLIADEAARRPIRRRTLDVIPYHPTDPRPETHLALEGTVTVLAARSGNPFIVQIREALANGKGDTADLARKLYLQYKRRKPVSLSRAVQTAVAQPVFGDVLHGGVCMMQNLFVPENMDVVFLPLPYNGGALADLVLVEHPVSEDVESLDVIALRHDPRLTAAERAAVDSVAALQSTLNVGYGPGPVACGTVLLTVAVVVEVAVVAVTFAITGKVSIEHIDHLGAGEIRKMGPNRAARELVAMRRQYLATAGARAARQ